MVNTILEMMKNVWLRCNMKVRLIGYTQPTESFKIETDISNVQDFIAYCARVSNPENQINNSTGKKLIKYLIEHKHWSPLEMVDANIEIETTRDIARQMLRHKTMSFQEYSQRYADPTQLENAFVIREARLQDPKNRQNSISLDHDGPHFEKFAELEKSWVMKQDQIIHEAKLAYKWAIENGIAKEQARCVLPEGNTVSRLYAKASIRTWIHYVELRSGHGTQKEHILLAKEIGYAISQIFPMMEDFIST